MYPNEPYTYMKPNIPITTAGSGTAKATPNTAGNLFYSTSRCLEGTRDVRLTFPYLASNPQTATKQYNIP